MSDVPTRLLRDALRGAAAPDPSAGCLDIETMAAWSDGTLGRGARAVAEAHASNCARCQALLAAMVKTQPAPQPTWWHRSAVRWLVPIAVSATAVVVWINVPASWIDRHTAQPASVPATTAESAPPRDRVDSNPAKTSEAELPPATAIVPSPSAGAARQRDAGPPRPQQFETQAREQALARNESREPAAVPPVVSPPAAATPDRPDVVPTVTAAAAAAPQANAVAPLAAAPPGRAILDAVAPGGRGPAAAKAAAAAAPIVSPDPNVRWRIVAGGRVDRSVDGGSTWQTQPTGVPAALSAGTAPAPTICWLVGAGGTVVLSVDGRTWQRVSIHEAIDLTEVRATDASNATVYAADGRVFTTTDGGKTWRP